MSGRLIQARKIRFRKRPKSKPLTRAAALKREQKKGYLAYLEKIGKLDEELAKMKAKKRFRRR